LVKGHPEFSNGYKPLVAALGHLEQFDEAQPYLAKLLELEPQFSVSQFAKTYPFRRDSDREHYMEGLRLAGAPE
jgi:adenylate cyclase